jgi:heme/copper-type cytochrome/quinol oxidase subunit 2
MKNHKTMLSGTLFLLSTIAFAQIPTDVPKPQDNPPLDLTDPANIIIFIVLPLCVILLYFIWRGKQKKKDKK